MDLINPLPLLLEDEPFRHRLQRELVGDLYRRAKAAILALTVVLFILWHVLGEAPGKQPLIRWIYGGLALVVLARLSMHTYLERHPEKVPRPQHRHLLFMLGTFLVGVGYACLNVVAIPVLSVAEFGMLAVSLTGINAGALLSMSASPASYFVYMVPSIGSLIWMAAAHPQPGYGTLMVLLLVVYLGAMMVLALQVYASLHNSILLGLRLGETAQRDSLTGLLNRRFLAHFMDQEWPRILRSWHHPGKGESPSSLAIIVADLDHFKQVNDTHGHLAGDAVLKQFSQLLLDTVRQPDVVVRWGGEEFVILALDTDRCPPLILAERIRTRLEAHAFVIPGDIQIPVRCSMGYTCLPFLSDMPGYLGWEECLHLADAALYLAKQRGRNQTVGVQEGPSRSEEALAALWSPGQDLLAALDAEAVKVV